MKTPREVIADWLWNDADQIDFDDMGEEAGMQVVQKLEAAGYIIVPKPGPCEHPMGSRFTNATLGSDGTSHGNWHCKICGHREEWDSRKS